MKLAIVNHEGTLVHTIDLAEVNLNKPVAKAEIWNEILRAVDAYHCGREHSECRAYRTETGFMECVHQMGRR